VTSRSVELIRAAILERMSLEDHSATDAEIEELRLAHSRAEADFYGNRLMPDYDAANDPDVPPPEWGELYAELSRRPTERGTEMPKHRHRPPALLPKSTIQKCERELGERLRRAKPRAGRYTLDAISRRVDLPRPRVTQMEKLMELGWPLLRTHPEYRADEDHVRLPTLDDARRLLGNG
jgi:hypothetical protein